jgi:hypothetical protein
MFQMNANASPPIPPEDNAPRDGGAPDGPCAAAERQRRRLDELAEIGMDVARAVARQANAEAPAPVAELSLAYARVSRAVRLTLMLQSRLLEAGARAETEAAERAFRSTPEYARKARVERIVERLAVDEHPDDEDRIDALIAEAGERLDDEDLYGDLMDRPMREIVARLCRDLGLDPDWTALAQEPWASEDSTSPIAEAMAGGGPPAAERAVVGEGGVHALWSFPPANSS